MLAKFFINVACHNEFICSSNIRSIRLQRTVKEHKSDLPTPRQPPPTPHISRSAHAQPLRRFRTFRKNIFPRILRQFGSDLKLRFGSDLKQCALSGNNVCFRFLSDISFLIWHVVSETVCGMLKKYIHTFAGIERGRFSERSTPKHLISHGIFGEACLYI